MQIKRLKHTPPDGSLTLDALEFGQVNLVVGLNASGKSRTVTAIDNLVDMITGPHVTPGTWEVDLVGPSTLNYKLSADAEGFVEDHLHVVGVATPSRLPLVNWAKGVLVDRFEGEGYKSSILRMEEDPTVKDLVLEDLRRMEFPLEAGGYANPGLLSGSMLRTLSLLVRVREAVLAKSSCIVVDNVGEGLDYERSVLLVEILTEIALQSDLQLIMTTTDKFVMNTVPLTNWIVLDRDGNASSVYSPHTHPDIFDDFRFTGLSNFDFLSLRFWSQGV